MNYLLIKDGIVITGNKVSKSDVLIGNSKILEIKKEIRRPEPETPVIDAAGRFILPGAIDNYHHDFINMDEQEMNRLLISEITNGTTTLFETFNLSGQNSLSQIQPHIERIKSTHVADFAFHISPTLTNEIEERDIYNLYIRNGISSFLVAPANKNDLFEGYFNHLLAAASSFDLTLVVELNDPEPFGSGYVYSKSTPKTDAIQHLAMFEAVMQRLKDATFPVLVSKLRFMEEVSVFKKFMHHNRKMYAEIELPCFLGEKSRFDQHDDISFLKDDSITALTTISPNDFCKLIEMENFISSRPSYSLMIGNTKNSPVFNRPDKYFGLKYFSSMFYTLSVVGGNLSITDFVECIATRPAKLFGLYPQKGVIRQGSDADIIIWNPDFERNLYCNIITEEGIHDMKLQGRTDFVFSKGKMVFDGESFYRENLAGQYLYRNPSL